MNENKAMWDVIQKRADNNPYLSRCYRTFKVQKSKLLVKLSVIEKKGDYNKNGL